MKVPNRTARNATTQIAQRVATRAGVTTLPPSALRCLVAVLGLCQERPGRGATWRGLIARLGITSPNGIKRALFTLAREGLIAMPKNQAGAIHPTCRLAVFLESQGKR